MSDPRPLSESDKPGRAWASSFEDVLDALQVTPQQGLSKAAVIERRRTHGLNRLHSTKAKSVLSIYVDQLKSIVILLLVAAGTLAILFSSLLEGMAIFAVIAINSVIGFVTEWRAIRSMEALSRLGHVETSVVRDGHTLRIPAEQVVPGDIVTFDSGDIVSADARLTETSKLQANESSLTGESVPVAKHTDVLAADTVLMDRENMVFKGTAIVRGTGTAVVVGTGQNTEIGKISSLVSSAESRQTPLERRLNKLGERLVWITIVVAVLLAGGGILAGREILLAIEVAIALAVAAIPEGLPIVATIALARGMWHMAGHKAQVARLSAVETLGATSVILTDKTGTLTENKMTATSFEFSDETVSVTDKDKDARVKYCEDDGPLSSVTAGLLDELLTICTLCSNADVYNTADGVQQSTGDPTEVALLIAAAGRDLWRKELLEQSHELAETAFDTETKLMATQHRASEGVLVAVKGAPESLIPNCTHYRDAETTKKLTQEKVGLWLKRADHLGDQGLRTLAVASKVVSALEEDPYHELTLLGIVGLEDPARAGISQAIQQCKIAGIEVIMVTGDHPATARNIALDVGIIDPDDSEESFISGEALDSCFDKQDPGTLLAKKVYSRVTPEQKLKLINFYQDQHHVVAMTGDGVNDAPALKNADIGVAMGVRGTDVAKEAAAIVLMDDNFNSIIAAVAEGRAIFENIRKFVVYLISCNISEILIVTLATIAGAPLPLLPLQILFLNLVTDVFPALALGVGEGSPNLMKQRPRPADERILTKAHWVRIGLHSIFISIAVLLAMVLAIVVLEFESEKAVTVSFCTLAFAQLWHVFNMRDNMRKPFDNEITRNPWVWAAIAICLLLIAGAVYLPILNQLLHLSHPGLNGWLVITVLSFLPVMLAPVVRFVATKAGR